MLDPALFLIVGAAMVFAMIFDLHWPMRQLAAFSETADE
jgi:hypothetical protein